MPKSLHPKLDRLVTVNLIGEGDRNDDGVWVPGPVERRRVWAHQEDREGAPIGDGAPEGSYQYESRRWLIRWNPDIARHRRDQISVTVDGSFETFTVEKMGELQMTRNRFLFLQADSSQGTRPPDRVL